MVQSARTVVAGATIPVERLGRVFAAADKESDRSAAILIFALAEDLMLEGLKANLNPKLWGNGKEITGPNGLLGTAANRLTLLQLLYWVGNSTAEDLRLMKAVRNHFAHHPDISSFDDPKLASLIGQLKPWEKSVAGKFDGASEEDLGRLTNRDKFLLRGSCAVAQLASDIIVGPVARSNQVHPRDVEGNGFDELPENIRQTRRLMAEAMIRCVWRAKE